MFRFNIRDLLWLIVVAAVALGWCAYHRRASESYKTAVKERDDARLLGGGLITTMRADGYEIEGPTWGDKTIARIMSKPKPIGTPQ
jgi:hypothetical protein